MKLLLILLFIFTVNCQGNKVSNYHGSKSLNIEYNKIKVNKTNKNDLIKLLGPPSTVSDFDNNKWFYIERLKTNQSLIKLGTQKIKKNNILLVQIDENGIVNNKKLLNIDDMNKIKYYDQKTEKDFQNKSILYDIFTSLREKINSPTRNLGK